jgi:hypothetical protein
MTLPHNDAVINFKGASHPSPDDHVSELTGLTWQELVVSAGFRHRDAPSSARPSPDAGKAHRAVRCEQAQAAPPIERTDPSDRREDDHP